MICEGVHKIIEKLLQNLETMVLLRVHSCRRDLQNQSIGQEAALVPLEFFQKRSFRDDMPIRVSM
jgi:hypothetical protein